MAAAWADKFASSPWEQKDPVGVIGITAPAQWPMLGLCSLLGPAIAAGNTVVVLPSDKFPLVAADLCQVRNLDINIRSYNIHCTIYTAVYLFLQGPLSNNQTID